MSTMVPALETYIEKGARPFVDGGYYVKTRENRALIGPPPVEGAYVSGAFSGFGVMASWAGGDLIARHVLGTALPDYAPAFMLSRSRTPPTAPCSIAGATADSFEAPRRRAVELGAVSGNLHALTTSRHDLAGADR